MKEEGASISDNSICGINHHEIFKLRSIHSKYGAPDGDGYTLLQIYGSISTTGNYYIGSDSKINPNDDWSKFSNSLPMSQSAFLSIYDLSLWD